MKNSNNIVKGDGMVEMSEAAKQARRDYKNKYNAENREHVNQKAKEWRDRNPDKVQAAQARYWEKKAAEASK